MSEGEIILACASGQLGGTELRIIEEACALRELGYRPAVAVSRFGRVQEYKGLLAERDIPFFDFNPPQVFNQWRLRHVNEFLSHLYPLKRLRRARLVHIFFPWSNLGLDHLWLAGLAAVPVVMSAHNAFPHEHFIDWHKQRLRTALAQTRGYYGVSRVAQEQFSALFDRFMPEGVISTTIYNFADTARFRPAEENRAAVRQSLGLAADTRLIGSVGRFCIQKRPLSLISVFDRLRRREPDSHLLLIGEGYLEDEVREDIARRQLQDQVTIIGFQRDIERYFPAMDLHLLLSGNEGFGLVTAEALACGVPTVGSHVTGTTEVIGDCGAGRLVEIDDENGTVDAIIELLELQARDRGALSRLARDHAVAHFSRESWLERIRDFYAAALAQATHPDTTAH